MSTGATRVDFGSEKRLVGRADFADRFLAYLRTLTLDTYEKVYGSGVVFNTALGLSPAGNDQFSITGASEATDGDGHTLDISGSGFASALQFENASTIDYDVALHYAEVPSGIQINPRKGLPEYIGIEEAIGESADPDLVTNNGADLTLRINSVCEPGVSHAGRTARVWRKIPGENGSTMVVAVEDVIVAWTGANNEITTAGLLGQTTISTTPADYTVVLLGPTVRRNTPLVDVDGYVFIGVVQGAGAGTPPGSLSTTDQEVVDGSLADLQDITSRNATSNKLKIDVKSDVLDAGDPQIQVRNIAGTAVFTVDGSGNVTINGTTTQQDVVQVNSSETITDNLTAGDATSDSHLIKGTWHHTDLAGSANHFRVNGATGRVGIGQVPETSTVENMLAVLGITGDVRISGTTRVVSTQPSVQLRDSSEAIDAGGLWDTSINGTDWFLRESTSGSFTSSRTWIQCLNAADRIDFDAALVPNSATLDIGTSGIKWRSGYFSSTLNTSKLSISTATGDGMVTSLVPGTDVTYDLGSASHRFKELRAQVVEGGGAITPVGNTYAGQFLTTTPVAPGSGTLVHGSISKVTVGHTSGTKAEVQGLQATGVAAGAGGTTTALYGGVFETAITNASAIVALRKGILVREGAVTTTTGTAYGIHINSSTTAADTKFGLDIGAVTGGSIINYALRTSTGLVEFGGTTQVTNAFPAYELNDTDLTPVTGGLWRVASNGSDFAIQENTAVGADFTTLRDWMTAVNASDRVAFDANVAPLTTNTRSIGTSTLKWSTLWSTRGAVGTEAIVPTGDQYGFFFVGNKSTGVGGVTPAVAGDPAFAFDVHTPTGTAVASSNLLGYQFGVTNRKGNGTPVDTVITALVNSTQNDANAEADWQTALKLVTLCDVGTVNEGQIGLDIQMETGAGATVKDSIGLLIEADAFTSAISGTSYGILDMSADHVTQFGGWAHGSMKRTTSFPSADIWTDISWTATENLNNMTASTTVGFITPHAGFYLVTYTIPATSYGNDNNTLMSRIMVEGVAIEQGSSRCGVKANSGLQALVGSALVSLAKDDIIKIQLKERTIADGPPSTNSNLCGAIYNGTSDLGKGPGTFTLTLVRANA